MERLRKRLMNSKRGSYIVEAVIILPVFIVAVILFISVVPRAARCEKLVFAICDEMAQENIEAHFFKSQMRCQGNIYDGAGRALKDEDGFSIDRLRYCYTDRVRSGRRSIIIDDVITADFTAFLSYADPLAMGNDIVFSGKLKCRPYTGSIRDEESMSREEMERDEVSEPVYVFPDWGEKYHDKGCYYLNPAFEMTSLSQSIRRSHRPCDLCHSGDRAIGTTVFLFRRAGEVYHAGSCKTVEKYYIEMEKDEAVEKGYTPCMKCGG